MKARKILLIAIAMIQIWVSEARAQGIKFVTDMTWEEVKSKAKKENKYIFLDMYTTWCGPCTMMDKDVYTDKGLGDFFNENMISVKVQLDSTKADNAWVKSWYQTAQNLGRLYNIKAYPSFVFLNPAAELVNKQTGLVSIAQFGEFVDAARDPAKQYALMIKDYNQGKREPNFVRTLIRVAAANDQKAVARKMALEYIGSLNDEQIFELENIWCLYENTTTIEDRGFTFFRDHADKIAKIEPKLSQQYTAGLVASVIANKMLKPLGKSLKGKADWKSIDSVVAKYGVAGKMALSFVIRNLIIDSEIMPYLKSMDGKPDWKRIEENVKRFGAEGQNLLVSKRGEFIFDSEIVPFLEFEPTWAKIQEIIGKYEPRLQPNLCVRILYYYMNGVVKNKFKSYNTFIAIMNNHFKTDPNVLAPFINQAAWLGFERFQSKEDLTTALIWSKMSIDKDPKLSECYDTYANLLYRLGNKKEALIWEEKAIEMKPENREFKQTLDKMKANLPTWPEVKG